MIITTNSLTFTNLPGVTQWVKKWESNGWKTAGGKGVINKDDIQRLLNLSSQLKIKWVSAANVCTTVEPL